MDDETVHAWKLIHNSMEDVTQPSYKKEPSVKHQLFPDFFLPIGKGTSEPFKRNAGIKSVLFVSFSSNN